MQKALFIIILLGITISGVTSHEFKFDEINNKKMIARNFDECIAESPDNCCFNGVVTLTIDYDDAKITSLKLTGKQAGNNCDGTFTAYPTPEFSTKKTIEEGAFMVTYTKDLQESHSFFSNYEEITKEGKTTWDATFVLFIGKQEMVILELYLDSEQNYIDDSKEDIDNQKKDIDNSKEDIEDQKKGNEDEKTPAGLLKYNILFLICSIVIFNFML